jgi:hypothetical protein
MNTHQAERKELIRQAALQNIRSLLPQIFPSGKIASHRFIIGNIRGDPGDSMHIELEGEKAGLWNDFATREGGDIFDLLGHYWSLDPKSQFPQLLDKAEEYFCLKPSHPSKPIVTGTWVYQDADGHPWVRVQRVEQNGNKQYYPFDYRTNLNKLPDIRPLYNLPNLAKADYIVLVEGEKCAQALIDKGITATTYIGGTNAPMSKTDSSPLRNKNVIIWPDKGQKGMPYARNALKTLREIGAASAIVLQPPEDKPDEWDVADAIEEGFDYLNFVENGARVSGPELLNDASQDRKFYFLHASELTINIKPISWLIKGIIEVHTLAMVFGAPESGKSFIALDMACAVATGQEFLCHATTQGAVFYIAGEGKNGLGKRLRAWEIENNIKLLGHPLYISSRPAQFYDQESAQEVEAAIEDLARQNNIVPTLIIIDTLARNFGGGDENQTADMNKFIQHIDQVKDKWSSAALIVHHTGLQEQHRARGSIALKGAMDHEYRVEKNSNQIIFTNTKMKDSEGPKPKFLTLKILELGIEEDGEQLTSCVIVPSDIAQLVENLTGHPLRMLNLIKKVINEGGEELKVRDNNSPVRGVKKERLKELFKASDICRSDKTDSVDKAFNRALETLKKSRFIESFNEYIYLPDKSDTIGQREKH